MNNISKKTLTEYLDVQRSRNFSAKDAVHHFVKDLETLELTNLNARTVMPELHVAYREALTALVAAIISRKMGATLTDIANILFDEFSPITSLRIGEILLNPEVYPNASSSEMSVALNSAHFSSEDVQATIKILYPVSFSVYANKSWQDTGVIVDSSHKTTISYVQGRWIFNPAYSASDGNGGKRHINYPEYTLPGAPEGALIGRIGSIVFLVGNLVIVPLNLSGKLQLCINDDLESKYGNGLKDNSGFLEIKITTE